MLVQRLLFNKTVQVAPFRALSLTPVSSRKWKWLSKEDAAKQHEVTIGFRHGNPDDPEYWPPPRMYTHSPTLGDADPGTGYFYRENIYNVKPTFLDRAFHKLFSSSFVAWFLYNMYYNPGMIFGHYYIPKPNEFTDEELGIPPDDAPDPEYWGLHGKPTGTTRYW